MPTAQLARLERVPLREAWPNEAGDFTPWLAQPENLRLLGETIGLELECECQEKPVGSFSCDILCRDTASDAWVIIENQIERTDHNHLGQLLTYAAGLKATTVVWVAREFREEHRAAIDWLNEITTEEFSFFGLEVELWRIADSPAAPKFNIVSKPNDWSRDVRESARDSGELSENRVLQREYWTKFAELLVKSGDHKQMRQAHASNHMVFPVGRSGAWLSTVISSWDYETSHYSEPLIRVQFNTNDDGPKWREMLVRSRERINSCLSPDKVHYYTPDNQKTWRIYVSRTADAENHSDWLGQHEWLRQRLQKFEQLFRSIVSDFGRD